MSTEMVCSRHFTLRSRTGHIIRFEPNVPKAVPDEIVSEALAVNIIPTAGVPDEATDKADRKPAKVLINGILRDALVLRVISELVRENDAQMFDGGGRPKTQFIAERTGLTLSAREREEYWSKYRNLLANSEELPAHPALEQVLEIQYLSTPKDTKEYAEALEVPEKAIIGRPLREQKQILLTHVLKHN